MARAIASFFTLLAFGAAALVLALPAQAADPCWKQVADDWSQDGRIDGAYPPSCIDEALAKVPEDIRAYSDFEEQAKAARQLASRTLQGRSGAGGGADEPLSERNPDTDSKDETPVGVALGTRGNNADSIPLPLLIMLGIAGLLIAAGAVGFGQRKLKARRVPPPQ